MTGRLGSSGHHAYMLLGKHTRGAARVLTLGAVVTDGARCLAVLEKLVTASVTIPEGHHRVE